MIVQVTQRHIDSGRPRNSCACPVALALGEHFDTFARVGIADIYVSNKGVFATSTELLKWIVKFDFGNQKVAPIELDLRNGTCYVK